MGKEFKDWVDEFVENGANPKDVTNWPEEAGGGTTVIANETLSGDEDTLTELTVEGVKYAVPQGGSGGGSLKLATVYYTGTEDYSYASSLTLLIDTSISTPTTYEELVTYLKELGFSDYSNVYPCSGIFNDDGFVGVITGITSEQNYSEEEPVEMLNVYGIVNNSAKYTFISNSEEFSITYLGQNQGE